MLEILGGIIVSAIMILLSGIKVVKDYNQLVVFRFGKLIASKGPGVHLVVPFMDQVETVDTRFVTVATRTLEELTQDNVAIKISAACLFQIVDVKRTVSRVDDINAAIAELTQSSLRSGVSQYTLRQMVTDSGKLNAFLKEKLEKQAKDWGIKIVAFEIKEINLPADVKKALLRENLAEAEFIKSEI